MVEDIKEIVSEQGETVKQYEKNIETSARHTTKAVDELVKTDKKTKDANTKLIIFAIVICVLLTLMWVIYAYTRS